MTTIGAPLAAAFEAALREEGLVYVAELTPAHGERVVQIRH
jgi:hypothetical protein